MKPKFFIPLVVIFLVLSCAQTSLSCANAKVVGVTDGDSVTVLCFKQKETVVRLYGIDCPERGQPFGKKAKQFTSDLIGGKTVDVVEKTKDLILDHLGVGLATSIKPWSVAVYKYARDFGGRGESTIVNYGDKVRAENAALANAAFSHGFEMDDNYFPGTTHPG